jgi:hypothetical protein
MANEFDDEKPVAEYAMCCTAFSAAIGGLLKKLETDVSEAVIMGQCPYDLPEDSSPAEMIAGGVLLLFCGMIADPDGGRDLLMQAASKLQAANLPMAEDIRKSAEHLLNTLGIRCTSHLWN